jgi:hypothetical protein
MSGPDRRPSHPPPNRAGDVPIDNIDLGAAYTITTGEAHAAALVVASYANDPDDARELLAMLGLIGDPRRPAP